jgi:hypothetical protein
MAEDVFKQAISRIFAFAYVWGLGGNLAPAARPVFDEHVREQLQDVVNIPGQCLSRGGSDAGGGSCLMHRTATADAMKLAAVRCVMDTAMLAASIAAVVTGERTVSLHHFGRSVVTTLDAVVVMCRWRGCV